MKENCNVCCALCAHFIEKEKPCRKQPLGIAHPETEFCSEFEEKCCGGCAWFHSEDTEGWGFCAANKGSVFEFMHCSDMCEDDYVSRHDMRHHMAVLLQASRYYEQGPEKRYLVGSNEFKSAIKFAYRYMKAFSKL